MSDAFHGSYANAVVTCSQAQGTLRFCRRCSVRRDPMKLPNRPLAPVMPGQPAISPNVSRCFRAISHSSSSGAAAIDCHRIQERFRRTCYPRTANLLPSTILAARRSGLAKSATVESISRMERQLVKSSAWVNSRTEAYWPGMFRSLSRLIPKAQHAFCVAAGRPSLPRDDRASVHHLCVIQASDGRWYNNRPPPVIQTVDMEQPL